MVFLFNTSFFFLESQSKGFECAADDNPTLGDFKFLLFKQKIHKIRIIDSTVTVRFYPVILGGLFLFVIFYIKIFNAAKKLPQIVCIHEMIKHMVVMFLPPGTARSSKSDRNINAGQHRAGAF